MDRLLVYDVIILVPHTFLLILLFMLALSILRYISTLFVKELLINNWKSDLFTLEIRMQMASLKHYLQGVLNLSSIIPISFVVIKGGC